MHPIAVSDLFTQSADLNYRRIFPVLGRRRYDAYYLNPKYFWFINQFQAKFKNVHPNLLVMFATLSFMTAVSCNGTPLTV